MTISSVPAEQEDISPPPHPGGGEWSYLVMGPDGALTYSDSLTDLVATVISDDHYKDLIGDDSDEANDACLYMRYDELVHLGGKVQAWMVQDGADRGVIDLANVGEDVLTVLFQSRDTPFEGVERGGKLSFEWAEDVPLVAVSVHYLPFSQRPAPTGRVVMLDPSSEMGFMLSLAALGAIEFYVTNGDLVAA